MRLGALLTALMTQRGADAVKRDAGRGLRRPRAIRKNRAHERAASKTTGRTNRGPAKSANENSLHQTSKHPLCLKQQGVLAGHILTIQAIFARHPEAANPSTVRPGCEAVFVCHVGGRARLRRSGLSCDFPATSMRTTRLQLRCNPGSCVGGAYTSFPLNLQFGEAGGDAPV